MESHGGPVAGETLEHQVLWLIPRTDAGRRLLDATIGVIDATGEGTVRVQDIADTAGVPIPVLYREFGNRDGLLQAAQVERLRTALDRELRDVKAAVESVGDAAGFRALFDAILASLSSVERRSARWKRINIIGSTYGRPALAEAVSQLQAQAVAGIAHSLRRAQRSGWLRDELDLDAFAAWFAGQTLGRILIELGESPIDQESWNSISADAVRHVLLGQADATATNVTDEGEVSALSDAYEAALVRNDVDAMNAAFWSSPEVVRFGIGETQFGIDEIEAWRATATPVSPNRTITRKIVQSIAPGVVAVDLTFHDGDVPITGRQSQTWVRRPEGWRIVRAHVSTAPAPLG